MPGRPTPTRTHQLRSFLRPPSPRITNLTLLAVLALTFATGVGVVATGSSHGRWVVLGHGIAGLAVVLLIPWKRRVVRNGLHRARRTRWLSLLLAALAVATILVGLGYSTGLVRSIGGVPGMWLHIAIALSLVPLVLWHVFARRTRLRRTDLSRRGLLRLSAFGVAAGALYAITDVAVRLARLPGRERRFTGSYEIGSFDPDMMPNTIWLDDSTPRVNPDSYRLTIVDNQGSYQLTLADLSQQDTPMRALLDCTSGWYAEQDWSGVAVSALLRGDTGRSQSLFVHSITGYWVRFPVRDLDHLLLATKAGAAPLSPGHGYPLRMVAPGRRGFWWVKWVDRIELQTTPWWWQPPFPLT